MSCLLHKLGNTGTHARSVEQRKREQEKREQLSKVATGQTIVASADADNYVGSNRTASFAAKRASSASRIETLLAKVQSEPPVVKPYQGLPVIKSNNDFTEFRVNRVKEMLEEEEQKLVAQRIKFANGPGFGKRAVTFATLTKALECGDDSQGASNEFLPLQQIMTSGKPTLCRPMPEAYSQVPSHLEKDSLFCSENRAEYWWKNNPALEKIVLKHNVRPMDKKYMYRENVLKMQAALRHPPVRSL